MTDIIAKYNAQKKLFSCNVSRLNLLDLKIENTINNLQKKVNVWMNHNFESIVPTMIPYLQYQNLNLDFHFSDYDDSFLFNGYENAEIEIVFMNMQSYQNKLNESDLIGWIEERISYLREISKGTILVVSWNNKIKNQIEQIITNIPQCHYIDLSDIAIQKNIPLLDTRTEKLSGTPLSKKFQQVLSRELSCKYIPACLFPSIKAVCLDLDNTLHQGVLGEDGIDGVILSEEHKLLQEMLKKLKEDGIFLALVSKNDEQDVLNLFQSRTEYPLSIKDFSAMEISWDSKTDSIIKISKKLNIGIDSILFVDDNIGELLSVVSSLEGIKTIHASDNATLTKEIISNYPRIWKWSISEDDKKRVNDLGANQEREKIAKSSQNLNEYFKSLGVTLSFDYNNIDHAQRVTDLCNKTNQFNLSLNRTQELDISNKIKQDNCCVASVSLSDKLSDSGIIGIVLAETDHSNLLITEVCISCRAMGRNLEDTIIFTSIKNMDIFKNLKTVTFNIKQGPRNQPAINWLKKLTKQSVHNEEKIIIDAEVIKNFNSLKEIDIKVQK